MFSGARNFDIRDSVFNAYIDRGTALSLARTCLVNSTMAENEVYARLLFRKQRGYALWKPKPDERLPEPYKQEGVRIGDVGVLNEFGGFDDLFNACLPADHPINAGRVPPDFKQLHIDESDTKGSTQEYQPGSHVANNQSQVLQSKVPYSEGHGPIPGVPEEVGVGLSFSSSASEGALLVLPEGGKRTDHQKYLNFSRGVPNGALYLITGFDKTRAWGVASFTDARPGSVHLDFVPKRSDNVIGAPEYHFSRSDFASWSSDADGISGNQSGCIFLRGLRIAVRTSRAFPRVKIASEVTDISSLNIDQLLTNQRTGSSSSASSVLRRTWQRFLPPKRSGANQEDDVLKDFFASLLAEPPLPAKFQVQCLRLFL
ncbi:hypothetical protein BDP27DRAFT_1288054 [Rhodocollybia butyracea]|uniref:Uncharacterized protein n=1 Tax=Rhodocollybia butyracea TaxID=206335 RepID=A0A9P5Q3S4_9AGAR|nr:hypothetical protein BDP27DRAFT_1288054 [Rhodocollybia butyracea]